MIQKIPNGKGIIGIDEAGRGPLAGPVSVGVVFAPFKKNLQFDGLKDSKQLSEHEREEWFTKINDWQKEKKLKFSVALVSNRVIDKKGIVYAINLGMKRCLKKIFVNPNDVLVLLDGSLHAPSIYTHQKTIVKGDEKISVISLASIAAKVTRDRYMIKLAKKYPEYRFETHKGYGTLEHRKLIKKYGGSKVHRTTFLRNIDR